MNKETTLILAGFIAVFLLCWHVAGSWLALPILLAFCTLYALELLIIGALFLLPILLIVRLFRWFRH